MLHLASYLPTLIREMFGPRSLEREPEPNLVMNGAAEVEAYREAGRTGGGIGSVYLYALGQAFHVIRGRAKVLDLGCGPATFLSQLAALAPQTQFTGVDLSQNMLDEARETIRTQGLRNVELECSDICDLASVQSGSVDAVVSTLALHHLPTFGHLKRALAQIHRVLKPDGALFLFDLGRLRSHSSVSFMAWREVGQKPYLFLLDYERSMRAAFSREEWAEALEVFEGRALQLYATQGIGAFLLARTAPVEAPPDTLLWESRRQALPVRFRNDLDDLRFFFRLSGLSDDPFKGDPSLSSTSLRQQMQEIASMPVQRALHTSLWARLLRALRLGVRYVMLKARSGELTAAAQTQFAQTLRRELGALKGPLMKVGQVFSYLGERLPLETRRALTPLRFASPALPAVIIRRCVEASLGQPIDRLYSEWDDHPLAAASLGQVHLARLHSGERVVVKVQYPGAQQSARADFRVLRWLSPMIGAQMHVSNARALIDELTRLGMLECDYQREAALQERARAHFAGDPSIVIPRVFESHSSRTVLTQALVEGLPLEAFNATATQEQRNAAAITIGRMTAQSIYRLGMLNADPHPGNYLFRDGSVCFLDFGFAREFEPHELQLMRRFGLAAYEGSADEFGRLALKAGWSGPGGALDAGALRETLRASLFRPWVEDRPFHFTPELVREEMQAMAAFSEEHGPIQLPVPLVAVGRLFWGHHWLLARLNATLNWHQILVPILREGVG